MRSARTRLQAAPHQGAASKDPKPGSRQRLTDNPVGPGRPPPPTCALRLGLHQPRPRRRRPRRPISPTRDPGPRKAKTRAMATQHRLCPDETLPRSRLARNSPSGRCPSTRRSADNQSRSSPCRISRCCGQAIRPGNTQAPAAPPPSSAPLALHLPARLGPGPQ